MKVTAEGLPQAAVHPGMRYQDLGADYYERQRDIRPQISHHVGQLGALGFEATLCRRPDPESGGPAETMPRPTTA